jgi:hypothetical protein
MDGARPIRESRAFANSFGMCTCPPSCWAGIHNPISLCRYKTASHLHIPLALETTCSQALAQKPDLTPAFSADAESRGEGRCSVARAGRVRGIFCCRTLSHSRPDTNRGPQRNFASKAPLLTDQPCLSNRQPTNHCLCYGLRKYYSRIAFGFNSLCNLTGEGVPRLPKPNLSNYIRAAFRLKGQTPGSASSRFRFPIQPPCTSARTSLLDYLRGQHP